jgi:hypothetical protein
MFKELFRTKNEMDVMEGRSVETALEKTESASTNTEGLSNLHWELAAARAPGQAGEQAIAGHGNCRVRAQPDGVV